MQVHALHEEVPESCSSEVPEDEKTCNTVVEAEHGPACPHRADRLRRSKVKKSKSGK